MTEKDKDFIILRQDYLERKIFLKRQLVHVTKKEIEALEKELRGPEPDPPVREFVDTAQRTAAL